MTNQPNEKISADNIILSINRSLVEDALRQLTFSEIGEILGKVFYWNSENLSDASSSMSLVINTMTSVTGELYESDEKGELCESDEKEEVMTQKDLTSFEDDFSSFLELDHFDGFGEWP